MGNFIGIEQDTFRPNYGGVVWTPRLNMVLEATGVELFPVGYHEDGKDPMQVTQDNAVIYINQVADELDVVAIKYDQDEEDIWTWYFRAAFERSPVPFEGVVKAVGAWACNIVTLYPMKHVVDQYERMSASDLDTIPDWL